MISAMNILSHQEDLRLRIIINVVESISGSVNCYWQDDNGQTVTAEVLNFKYTYWSGKTKVVGFDSGVQCGSISVSDEDLGTVKILICNGKGEANKSLLFHNIRILTVP